MAEDVFLNHSTAEQDATRRALRAEHRERRRAVPVRERLDAAAAVSAALLPWLIGQQGRIAGYWAVGGELPLHAVQANLPATLQWCLPVLHDDQRLRFREWSAGGALEPNGHGIPEPTDGPLLEPDALSIVLVPLLAFDAQGQRLGQGGGWYDRSFAFRKDADRAQPLLVGIGYDWQQVEALHAAPWDVALDAIATPAGVRQISAAAIQRPS